MTRRPSYVYDKARREKAFRQRLRIYQFDDDIIRAYRGDTKGLCNYLRSDLPLSEEQREGIAELIYRRIECKQRGRPRGSDPVPNPARDAERQIAYQVRRLKSHRFGDKPAPKGALEALINEVITQWDKDDRFDDLDGQVSLANVRSLLKRGARRRAK
jgi:hypothetical protein